MEVLIRKDGYVNATQLCKAGNKKFNDYQRLKQTQDYLQALSSIAGIPVLELMDSKVGGDDQFKELIGLKFRSITNEYDR